jgi:spore germination protein YaaH
MDILNIGTGSIVLLGVDTYGKAWYSGVDANGNLIYSYTQNGVVKGAGYMNITAKEMISRYGLR